LRQVRVNERGTGSEQYPPRRLLAETFVRVLELAQALKFLQVGQITVAVDGTKVLAKARAAAEMAEYQVKLAERAVQKDRGEKPRGPEPKEPSQQPKPSDQYHFTDPTSPRKPGKAAKRALRPSQRATLRTSRATKSGVVIGS